jgi:lipopolysaccharide biosynthesis regulator YciM
MFDTPFEWLLLLLGVALGWALARRGGVLSVVRPDASRADAIASLSSLARDDADQAIAALTRAVEAEPGAIELRLTLGGLFRKRGEIDRAILLHETVLTTPGLSAEQSALACFELAQDYLRGGVMDRAESLAQSLVDSPYRAAEALELLLDLYEQAHDWPQAINAAQRWQAVRGQSAATRIAHYHCELADAALAAARIDEAAEEAKRAQSIDPLSTRASMILGAVEEKRGRPAEAVEHYRRALETNPVFARELLPPIERCAQASRNPRVYAEILEEGNALADVPLPLVLAKARWLAGTGGDAVAFLTQRLASRPEWESLLMWLEISGNARTAGAEWETVRTGLQKQLAARPRYRCGHCGFTPGLLFWQCPSCKLWGTVRPVDV